MRNWLEFAAAEEPDKRIGKTEERVAADEGIEVLPETRSFVAGSAANP